MEVTNVRAGDVLIVTVPQDMSLRTKEAITKTLDLIKQKFSLAMVVVLTGSIQMEVLRPEAADPEPAIHGLKKLADELEMNVNQQTKT